MSSFDLEKYQAKLKERFRNPRVDLFESRIARDLPLLLMRIYSLREELTSPSSSLSTKTGTICIQYFRPLGEDTIQEALEKYNRSFYPFAVDCDGQNLLYSFENPDYVWVSYDDNEIESTEIKFDDLVAVIEQKRISQ